MFFLRSPSGGFLGLEAELNSEFQGAQLSLLVNRKQCQANHSFNLISCIFALRQLFSIHNLGIELEIEACRYLRNLKRYEFKTFGIGKCFVI